MAAAPYVPDEGDIVWLNFTPQSGHEQAGRRAAVVLSNSRSGLLVCVPITADYRKIRHLGLKRTGMIIDAAFLKQRRW